MDEVAELLDETSQELNFSRRLLQATMENVAQGISVVDAELKLLAWNRRYVDMFGYPDGFVYVGRPVADLMHFNAERGELGPASHTSRSRGGSSTCVPGRPTSSSASGATAGSMRSADSRCPTVAT